MIYRLTWILVLATCSIHCAQGQEVQTPAAAPTASSIQTARGVVYEDTNSNKRRDADETGLPGIKVSNGVDIVLTNDQGEYSLPISDDAIVFVIKPRGWMTPINAQKLPQFYYIHKPSGSPHSNYPGVSPTGPLPASIDFPLTRQDEPDQFKALLFGDTQPRNVREVEYMTHDIIDQVVAAKGHGASLGVTLGDVVFDDLSVFEPHNQAIALVGLPWYNVIGNHDMNYDAPNDKLSDETFERYFGPSYYSFDYGPVHFIALDDVTWHGATETTRGHYTGGLGPEQMKFVKNDLSMIPKDQLVVLMMHIPLIDVEDRHPLYRLIEERPFALSISAHTHFLKHHFIGKEDGFNGPEPHHHFVNVTVCGSWWRGAPDELGIPHATMSDGGPNGYSIITFDGSKYNIEYRAARRPAEYQMNIHLPKEVNIAQAQSTVMMVNVFNGSKQFKVRFRHLPDGQWQPMERIDGIDPYYAAIKESEASDSPPNGGPLPAPSITDHLWRALLPAGLRAGTHQFEVEATDASGKVTIDRETVRVIDLPKPPEAAASSTRSAGKRGNTNTREAPSRPVR